MELLVGILVVLILVVFIRASHLRDAVDSQEKLLRALSERVWKLEVARSAQTAEVPAQVHVVVPPPVPVSVAAFPVVAEPAVASPVVPPPLPYVAPPPAIPVAARVPLPPYAPPQPSLAEQLRKAMGDQEWEALVGRSILNKVGALVLVIGIALFLAYSLAHMGPAGRAGTALAVSLTLLGTGVWVERMEKYRVFSRGLIGAGWAAIYATAYAIYAIPEARIIDSPLAGSLVLLLVAAGMIAHSLRYHVQGVTAVAFFSAFAALAASPSTPFSVIALIPLAGALLYLAQRFNWYPMALLGLLATYGACVSRGSSNVPVVESEALFLLYWALFELFDLLRFARSVRGWAVELIFPLNAAGFMALSYASWMSKAPDEIWKLSICAAAMYLVSTLWRAKIGLDRGLAVDEASDLGTRIRSGCYEAPLALASFLTAAAIVEKLTGMWMSTALAIEAEMLFTTGIRFRSRFVRGLATLGFVASMAQLVFFDVSGSGRVDVLGHSLHAWVPVLLLHALLFYVNRAMSAMGSKLGLAYSWAGSILIATAIAEEFPVHSVTTGWLLFAAILLEIGLRKKLIEFRQQAYLTGAAAILATLGLYNDATPHPWVALTLGLALVYAAAWRAAGMEEEEAVSQEWKLLGWCTCGATALFAGLLVWRITPDLWRGAALWALAGALLELGIRSFPARLRIFGYPVAMTAALAVMAAHDLTQQFPVRTDWASYLIAASVAWAMSGRILSMPTEAVQQEERAFFPGALLGVGFVFGMACLWCLVPEEFTPALWALLALAVLEAGNIFAVRVYRLEAQVVAGLAALGALGFALPDGHPHRLIAIAMLIAILIGFRLRSIAKEGVEGQAPSLHLCAAAILAAALIFQEVSGSVLTVAWGAEALVLLGSGFVFRERPLRLQGLALFLVCILKLFVYDLRNLETPYRILSFIALGLILLGVSWAYTRFREHLQKLF